MEHVSFLILILLIFLLSYAPQLAKPKRSPLARRADVDNPEVSNDDAASSVGPPDDLASVRRTYLNVFALMTAERRAALIPHYEA